MAGSPPRKSDSPPRGRSASENVPNRFEKVRFEFEPLEMSDLDTDSELRSSPKTEWFIDHSQSIVSENQSPDVPFRYSINPYRGCEHGCAYCYARPTHEYLGWSAGLDFESRILVKPDAASLLRDWLRRPAWNGERLSMSGVTDPYQPIERRMKITRSILEVGLECQQAITLITKNALVERDLDLLSELAKNKLTSVAISLTTLDAELARVMEPRCSAPAARLRAIENLSQSGVQVFVSVAPIIPGLNDHEIPAILEAAGKAGARGAGMTLLRLPGAVEPVFLAWLERSFPLAQERILSRIRSTRNGELHQNAFGKRMRGDGPIALQIRQSFEVFRAKYGLNAKGSDLDTTRFRPPTQRNGQQMLF